MRDQVTNRPVREIERLLLVRTELAALKKEEAALRRVVLAMPDGRHHGKTGAINIVTRKTRTLDRTRIPSAILEDPGVWKTTKTRYVTVVSSRRPDDDAPLSDLIDDG